MPTDKQKAAAKAAAAAEAAAAAPPAEEPEKKQRKPKLKQAGQHQVAKEARTITLVARTTLRRSS